MRGSASTSAIRVSPFVLTWPRLLELPLAEVARASAIPLAKLEAATEFTYEETLAIWDALEWLTGDPAVGVHAGARFTLDQMGVVGPALAHATHVDAALDALVRIMNVFVKNAGIRRVTSDAGAGIAYRMPTLRSPHGARTLQRKLGAMKTTFAAQRGTILRRRTTQLLMQETTPIETVAERLGYSSRAAFERAFWRWSGKTPHAVRAERA